MAQKIRFLFIALLLFSGVAFSIDTININTADKAALIKTLHGVGEKRAAAIIAYREKNGPFQSPKELTKVKGIDTGIFNKNRDYLSID